MSSLTKDMDAKAGPVKKPWKIFQSDRLINANTTESVGKGKMEFKVTHNFEDIAGSRGGLNSFFGLDAATDVRIGFHMGITDRLTIAGARAKGGGSETKTYVPRLYELSAKYELLRQQENDPSHPISMAIFVSNVISSEKRVEISDPSTDNVLNYPTNFADLGDRMAQVVQAIFAKRINRVSALINFTLVHQGYVPLHDEQTIFAIGGALRLPLTKNINFLIDYFHPFRSSASEDYFKNADASYNPPNDIDKNERAFRFYDPLGMGFEIVTAGHVFHLNFTNSTDILESRFIPYSTRSWSKGQFRWGFNIARTFVLWREKK